MGVRVYSLDLRTRTVDAVERRAGIQRAVAALYGVSRTCVKKLLRRQRETGSLALKPHGGGHGPQAQCGAAGCGPELYSPSPERRLFGRDGGVVRMSQRAIMKAQILCAISEPEVTSKNGRVAS